MSTSGVLYDDKPGMFTKYLELAYHNILTFIRCLFT